MKLLGANEEDISQIVESSDKKRFNLSYENNIWLIGANQGHSKNIGNQIDDNKLLEPVTKSLNLCVHGTYSNVIDQIKAIGLSRMEQTHIHFATDYPNSDKVISGARSNSDVFVEINMDLAMRYGIKFYKSANGVILTEGIEGIILPKYFSNIIYK